MTAVAGKDVLLKVATAAAPSTFVTVAGIRTTSISLGATPIDITTADSAGRWRELLDKSGTRQASLSGAGVFKDQASEEAVRKHFFDDTSVPCEFLITTFGTMAGTFRVTALEYSGEHDGVVSYSMTFESAGAVTFTVAT
jgi:TP901-1 family phage major tail protein